MGSRGPQAKPVELKLLQGGRVGGAVARAASIDGVFRPDVGLPAKPKGMSREADKAWARLSKELLRYNLLSDIDRDVFASLCRTAGRIDQLEIALTKRQDVLLADGKDVTDAFVDVTPNGFRQMGATYQVLKREQVTLKLLCDSFGLTPSARAAVTEGVRKQLQLFEQPTTPDTPTTPPQSGFAGFA